MVYGLLEGEEIYTDKDIGYGTFSAFLFQVLKQGSSPLAYLTDHVARYVACVKDETKEGCDIILKPPKNTEAKRRTQAVRWPTIQKEIEHFI